MEVALSVIVLAAAGLLIGSFLELTAIDPGFVAGNVAAFRADPTSVTRRFSIAASLRVLDELSHTPDVVAAALASKVPFVGGGFGRAVRVPGEPAEVMTTFHTVDTYVSRSVHGP